MSSSSDTVFNDEDSNDDEEETETEEEVGPAAVTEKTTCFGGAVTLKTEEEDDTDQEIHQNLPTTLHVSKDYSLQCWEDMLEWAVQQCNSRDETALSRTSSVEELTSIFGDQDTQPTPLPTTPQTQPPTTQSSPKNW